MNNPHNPFRFRRVWWTESGFLVVSLVYLGSGGIFILWISYLEFPIAAQAVGILWIIVYAVIVMMYKRVLSEPKVYVKGRIVHQTADYLQRERLKERNKFVERELAQLQMGERNVVLDIWKTDQQLAKRHSYFSETGAIFIDPATRECHIRIQRAAEKRTTIEGIPSTKVVPSETIEYLRIISTDGYLMLFRKYFDRLVVVIDRLEMDDRGGDVVVPILSILLDSDSLWNVSRAQTPSTLQLARLGDLRFDDGREIEPHRTIELPRTRGTK